MIQSTDTESLTGSSFDDVLNELHAHTFSGVPGESTSFTLPLLEREYIAYALACYYRCEHCVVHHTSAIQREINRGKVRMWPWNSEIETALLYLRHQKSNMSEREWPLWEQHWNRLTHKLQSAHGFCLSPLGYAIGIARADTDLMDLIWPTLANTYPDGTILRGVVSDIFRVVVFMKAATTKNRVIDTIRRHQISRGL